MGEDYEPEADPLETIVCSPLRPFSLAEVETQLRWAIGFGRRFGAALTHAGLGIVDHAA